MLKYKILELEDDLSIGIYYHYNKPEYSQDRDLPSEATNVKMVKYDLVDGDLIDLMQYLDNSNGDFMEGIEARILEMEE